MTATLEGYATNGSDVFDYHGNESALQLDYETILMILSENGGAFEKTTEIIIITIFTLMIIFGTLGNGLVCLVVIRNSHMRTPRNIFIINLAISDLTLCLFTQPLNLYRLLNNQFHLGSFMCKLSAMLQGTNVFVSTISITAIALDRFQVIVYPTRSSIKRIGGVVALVTIWLISLLMSSPLIIFSEYRKERPLKEIDFYLCRCIEDVTLRAEKGAYSIASMIVQYIFPVVIVSIAHARICKKLKYRMIYRRPQTSNIHISASPMVHNTDGRSVRKRNTNILLAMITIMFVFSWTPLNISNVLIEFQFHIFRAKGMFFINLVFVICHMLVLSSACTNPLIYGWLNDNFRKEFVKVLHCKWCFRLKTKWTYVRRAVRKQDVPVLTSSDEYVDESVKVYRKRGMYSTNTIQMCMTTEIVHPSSDTLVSL